ncbi:MAG: secondary thiamine-phosphate synthase enzyme YjbQ [Planctomycetota bacterium]
MTSSLTVSTTRRGLVDITAQVTAELAAETAAPAPAAAACTLFVPHTTAGLVLQDTANPEVLRDLQICLDRLVPDTDGTWTEHVSGPQDRTSYLRAMLTRSSITIPMHSGKLALGDGQGIYLWEHLDRGSQRSVLFCLHSST